MRVAAPEAGTNLTKVFFLSAAAYAARSSWRSLSDNSVMPLPTVAGPVIFRGVMPFLISAACWAISPTKQK